MIDASVCHCACVCLRSQCSLCVCPGAVCTKQPLFRRKLEKYREKIAETSTITVDAEVLRNLAVTAKTLVYNRRTALCRRSTRMLLCQTDSGCHFVLCQLSLNLSVIHTRCFVEIFISLSSFRVMISVCLTVIDKIKGTNTIRGFMYNDTVFRDRGAAPMTFVMMQYGPKLTGSQELAGDKRGRVWYPLFVFTGSTTRTDKGKGWSSKRTQIYCSSDIRQARTVHIFVFLTCDLFRLYLHFIGVSTGLRTQLLHSVRRGPRKQFRILCLS